MYYIGQPYENTARKNELLGAQRYFGLNNKEYFPDEKLRPGDEWGQTLLPPRERVMDITHG